MSNISKYYSSALRNCNNFTSYFNSCTIYTELNLIIHLSTFVCIGIKNITGTKLIATEIQMN